MVVSDPRGEVERRLQFVGPITGIPVDQLQLAVEASGLGTWRWDISTGEVDWDPRLEAIYGFATGEFPGTFEAYTARLHPDDRDEMLATVERAVATREPYQVEHRVVWPDGTVRWVQGSGQVRVDESGEVIGAIGCSMDVTDLMEARLAVDRSVAEAEASAERERANRVRLEFIAEINDALAEAVTSREVVEEVTRSVVPELGDWCLAFVIDQDHPDRGWVEVAHADPSQQELADLVAERMSWAPDETGGIGAVIRSGQALLLREIDEDTMDQLGVPEARRAVARQLGFRSAITVPLRKRGRVLGALMFVMAESGRQYGEDDLALGLAVAGRVASAIENRRLSDLQRTIATTLQRSLLPHELPEVPDVDVAVRYWAGGEGTEVGGDFYDLIQLSDNRWAAVMGDVCGTGPGAAALTSLARHTIRLCSWRGDDPATVLRWLNRALLETGDITFLTAVYVLLEPTDDGVDLSVTCGGHPLPVVAGADGTTRPIGRPGTLLGCFPDVRLEPAREHLAPGETLVLYTDGICDLPPPHDLDEADVRDLVGRAAAGASDPDTIARRIDDQVGALLPMLERSDDVALLLIRPRNG